jgi:hypothetical protein
MAQRDRREYFKQRYQAQKETQRLERRQHYAKNREAVKAQMAGFNAQYYQDNSSRFAENARRREREIKEFIQQQKAGLSCKQCGNADIRVLDFHHADKNTKEASISSMAKRGWGKERILKEIAKCEVLCANCHRILHWEERNEG